MQNPAFRVWTSQISKFFLFLILLPALSPFAQDFRRWSGYDNVWIEADTTRVKELKPDSDTLRAIGSPSLRFTTVYADSFAGKVAKADTADFAAKADTANYAVKTDTVDYAANAGNSDKLDNLNSTQFLRSDVTDTAFGSIRFDEIVYFDSLANFNQKLRTFADVDFNLGHRDEDLDGYKSFQLDSNEVFEDFDFDFWRILTEPDTLSATAKGAVVRITNKQNVATPAGTLNDSTTVLVVDQWEEGNILQIQDAGTDVLLIRDDGSSDFYQPASFHDSLKAAARVTIAQDTIGEWFRGSKKFQPDSNQIFEEKDFYFYRELTEPDTLTATARGAVLFVENKPNISTTYGDLVDTTIALVVAQFNEGHIFECRDGTTPIFRIKEDGSSFLKGKLESHEITPSTTTTYDLGSAALQWDSLFVEDGKFKRIESDSGLTVSAGTVSLPANEIGNAEVADINGDWITDGSLTEAELGTFSRTISFGANFMHYGGGTPDDWGVTLGTAGITKFSVDFPWKEMNRSVYLDTITIFYYVESGDTIDKVEVLRGNDDGTGTPIIAYTTDLTGAGINASTNIFEGNALVPDNYFAIFITTKGSGGSKLWRVRLVYHY